MIRIDRGVEPRGLQQTRGNRLAGAIAAYNSHGVVSDDLLIGYNSNATKTKLYFAQHKKCAWCERIRDFSSSPVEHYRPRDGAWRHLPGAKRRRVDPGYYWWLTWTWENLLFSCSRCNDQGHKANYFPLVRGTRAARLPSRPIAAPSSAFFDVSAERSSLVDPTDPTDDPLDHVRWRPVDSKQPREDWLWTPVARTTRGRNTIKVLKLAEIADEVGDHLKCRVLRRIEGIEEYFPSRRTDAARRWNQLLADTLARTSPLSAATWCALEIWMPASTRRQYGLAAPPRPGA